MNKHPHMPNRRIGPVDGVRAPFITPAQDLRSAMQIQLPRRNFAFLDQGVSFVFTVLLCISTFGLTFGSLGGTLSYFRDGETSPDNAFAAGQLGFRLNPGDVTVPIKPGEHISISPLFTPENETFPIRYRVRAEVTDDSPLCDVIEAYGTTSPYLYSGKLRALVTNPATTTGRGNFEVTLPGVSDLADGTRCTVAIVYRGWFDGAPENTGYTDEERDTFTFVLNNPAPQKRDSAEKTATSSEETPEIPAKPASDDSEAQTPPTAPAQDDESPPAETTTPAETEVPKETPPAVEEVPPAPPPSPVSPPSDTSNPIQSE